MAISSHKKLSSTYCYRLRVINGDKVRKVVKRIAQHRIFHIDSLSIPYATNSTSFQSRIVDRDEAAEDTLCRRTGKQCHATEPLGEN